MAYLQKEPVGSSTVQLKNIYLRDPEKGSYLICELLDVLMEPARQSSADNNEDLATWVKELFTTEKSFGEFCSKVSAYDKSPFCGCVWTKDFVAYRCKTCATSPCMSICAACFEKGNHKGHEYNIFRSEAGGACDCGDASVMKESGFCTRHGVNKMVLDSVPPNLLTLPKLIMERILIMLLHSLRYMVKDSVITSSFPSKMPESLCKTLDVFIEAIKCGSPIRSWVAEILLSEEYYTKLNNKESYGGCVSEEMKTYHSASLGYFLGAVKRLPMCDIPEEVENKKRYCRSNLIYKNILQELMFWLCRFEYQEHLVLVILNMLPDGNVKQAFARYFVQHYIFIGPSLIRSRSVEEFSNRIVHISVQLFSNNDLAYTLANEEALLEIFVISLNYMVTQKLIESKTTEADFHQMVSTAQGLQSNAHWAIVSDLVNCLGHHDVVKLFLNNNVTLGIWMRILTCFSGMNLTIRQLERHIEYDPQHVLLAFYSEREACAAPFWVMIDVMRDASTLNLATKVIEMCEDAIIELLDALGVDDPEGTGIPFDVISFHYPIHRYFSLFVANAVGRQGLGILDLGIEQNLARRIMAHPLQVLCTAHEIQSSMWVRNGLNTTSQQLAYRQAFFSTFFIDADLFSLQLLSCYMSADIFVSSIFDRCRVTNCLTVEPDTPPLLPSNNGSYSQPEVEKQPKMLEGAFTILLSVLSISTQLGLSDKTIIENELITVLSIQNWTHSGLLEHIPQCHDMHAGEKSKRFTEPLAEAIEELSIIIEGDAMAQTQYSLRDEVWPRYDPIFTLHRSLYRKTVQQAHTNYFKYLQRKYKLSSSILESSIWPPYQPIRITDVRYSEINRILNCRTLHTTLFMILYKFLHKHNTVTEQTLAMAITILDGALFASPYESNPENNDAKKSNEDGEELDNDAEWQQMLNMWFKSDYMSINIRQVIDQIQLSPECTDIFHDAMETDEELDSLPHASKDNPERCIVIQESILTLLIKLHDKFAGSGNGFVFPSEFIPDLDPPSPVPPTPHSMIAKVVLLAASKSLENQKIIKDICGAHTSDSKTVNEAKSNFESERERRKRAALEMQQRLLKEFANQQKKFLEQAEMDLDLSMESDEDTESASMNEIKYDCVVCGASEGDKINVVGSNHAERTNSAKSQVMGLVGLVQSSSVLGFRTESEEPPPLSPPNSKIRKPDTCRNHNQELHKNFKKMYPDMRRNFDHELQENFRKDWEWSPQVSTCGHHLHVSCYHEYMKWVRRDETGYLRFEEGLGFQCPVCRQTSNIIVPCNVAQERPVSDPEDQEGSHKSFVQDRTSSVEGDTYKKSIWKVQNVLATNSPVTKMYVPDPSFLNFGPGTSIDPVPMKEIHVFKFDEIVKACKESTDAILAENRISSEGTNRIKPHGVLHGQLEYELCHYGGTLSLDKKTIQLGTVSRRIPIGPMFHIIMKSIRTTEIRTNNDYAIKLWKRLTGNFTTTDGVCPLFFKDPVSLLLELCVALYPFTLEEYQTVVSVVYNLALVEALVQISCKFSPEERRAWKSNISVSLGGIPFSQTQLDSILGLVISCLPKALFEDDSTSQNFPSIQVYTSTVWTPQSVQSSLEEPLLHYLRISSLLQFHVFENLNMKSIFPGSTAGENEFAHLTKYLGIRDQSSPVPLDNLCTSLAKWPTSPRFLINQWCKEVEATVLSDRPTSFSILTRHRVWKQPYIIKLPDDYTNLFNKFRNITCPRCNIKSQDPCVCLMCGEFVCFKGGCSQTIHHDDRLVVLSHRNQGTVRHARQCGNGTVILLNINNTTIMVFRGTRTCIWGTLYLDHHGEEDRGWKRGKQLMLKQQRLNLLNFQWINHIFDNACRGWRKHPNQI